MSSSIQGGLRTQSGGRLVLGQQDLIQTRPPRTRKIVMSLLSTTPTSLVGRGGAVPQYQSQSGKSFQWPADVYIQKVAPPTACGLIPNFATFAIPIPKAYLENVGGGTLDGMLSSVTLNYRVLSVPGGLTPPSGTNPFLAMWSQLGPNPGIGGSPQGWQQLFLDGGQLAFGGSAIWSPGSAASVGQYYSPVDSVHLETLVGFYFKVTATTGSGRTGVSPPAWDVTPGAVTVDGGLEWTCIGGTGNPLLPGATGSGLPIADWYNGGNPQTLRIDFDTTLPRNGLNLENNYFMVALSLPSDSTKTAPFNVVPMILHSLTFEFTGYQTLSWR